jgi:hypothetical protein
MAAVVGRSVGRCVVCDGGGREYVKELQRDDGGWMIASEAGDLMNDLAGDATTTTSMYRYVDAMC